MRYVVIAKFNFTQLTHEKRIPNANEIKDEIESLGFPKDNIWSYIFVINSLEHAKDTSLILLWLDRIKRDPLFVTDVKQRKKNRSSAMKDFLEFYAKGAALGKQLEYFVNSATYSKTLPNREITKLTKLLKGSNAIDRFEPVLKAALQVVPESLAVYLGLEPATLEMGVDAIEKTDPEFFRKLSGLTLSRLFKNLVKFKRIPKDYLNRIQKLGWH